MEVVIIDGDYKGCEALVFIKGVVPYFRDDEVNSDIPLANYTCIKKNGVLEDVFNLLNVASNSKSASDFIRNIDFTKIKETFILRKGRIEKFYKYEKEIHTELIRLVKMRLKEENIFSLILKFIESK